MNIGGTIEVEGVRFTMTQAVHSSWLEEGGIGCNGGAAAGYVITDGRKKVYHAGDTALFSDMKLIGDLYRPDVALLPIGGRFTMGPEEAMMAAQYVGAPPGHPDPLQHMAKDFAGPGKVQICHRTDDRYESRILSPGETIEL